MACVMGLDQHRAQIAAEWIDTITGEIARTRIAPAGRAGVREFLEPFRDCGLEVALEATTEGADSAQPVVRRSQQQRRLWHLGVRGGP